MTPALGLRGATEVICHGDPCPCNAVFHDGLPYAWIDFDGAYPGPRSDDLGYAAWLWLDIGNDDWAPDVQQQRLAQIFADNGAPKHVTRITLNRPILPAGNSCGHVSLIDPEPSAATGA